MALWGLTPVLIYGSESSDSRVYLQFIWEVIETDAVNNTSTIHWTLQTETINTRIDLSGFLDSNTQGWSVTIEDKLYTGLSNVLTEKNAKKILASGTEVMYHDGNNEKEFSFSFAQSFGRVYGIHRGSGTGSISAVERNAKVISAPDFTEKNNPTITYSNPAGTAVTSLQACISLTGSVDNVAYRDIPKDSDTYTFELTDAEKTALAQGITSGYSTTVRFYIKTTIDGKTYWHFITRNFTLAAYAPTVSPTVVDFNPNTIRLTGNKNTLIRYFSNALCTFNAKAAAGAEIESRKLICGSQTLELEDSAQDSVSVYGVDSNTFYFSATDTRGYTVRDALVKSLVPYVKLTCAIDKVLLDANGVLTVTVSGRYYNGSFGAVKNSLELEYAIQEVGGDISWTPLGVITPTMSGSSSYSYTFTISGLDYQKQYELTVNAIDEVMPQPSTATKVISTIPLFDWGKEDFAFNVPVKPNKDIVLPDYGGIYGHTSDGDYDCAAFIVGDDTVSIGGGYAEAGVGSTQIWGDNVEVWTNNDFLVNGEPFNNHTNKLLWSGTSHMNGNQTINLSEAISKQPLGIVLVFSTYENSTGYANNTSWNVFFVPKYMVHLNNGGGQTFLMGINAGFSAMGAKYLFIKDTSITGHAGNTSSGANSGITFNNSEYVLRYVIGV